MSARRFTLALATGVTVLALGAGPAMAKEFRVDDDGAQCPNAGLRRRSRRAVNASGPGDKIKVCAGTYQEQVRIDEHHDKLEARVRSKKLEATISLADAESAPLALASTSQSELDDVQLNGLRDHRAVHLPRLVTGASTRVSAGRRRCH